MSRISASWHWGVFDAIRCVSMCALDEDPTGRTQERGHCQREVGGQGGRGVVHCVWHYQLCVAVLVHVSYRGGNVVGSLSHCVMRTVYIARNRKTRTTAASACIICVLYCNVLLCAWNGIEACLGSAWRQRERSRPRTP